MTRATVLVPTHRHAGTLPYAVGSALVQTIADLEVFVVGDGVDEPTRDAAYALARADPRVRFFDFPKGPRHGEIHRHAALREAAGEIVCYLSDDDLYYPDHVAVALDALRAGADFAHALAVFVAADGSARAVPGTPAVAAFRTRMLTELRNVVALSAGAHTRALYERLPHGWRTSPDDVWTDLHMWRQILALDDVCVAMLPRPTVVVFPSPWRSGVGPEARAAELATFVPRLEDEADRRRLEQELLLDAFRASAAIEVDACARLAAARAEVADAAGALAATRDQLAHTAQALAAAQGQLSAARAECEDTSAAVRALQREREGLVAALAALRNSPLVRLRDRALAGPWRPGVVALRRLVRVLAG